MKLLKKIFFFSFPLLLCGCADESPFGPKNSGEGKINLNLSYTTEVNSETPSVRSVSDNIVAPDASQFQIRLSAKDGSYVKTWASLADFEKEESFKVGSYDIEAFYGAPSSQGMVEEGEEGHEHAYYHAIQESIEIKSDETTNIQLEAKLANSVVIIEYTDAFKKYFKNWETTLKTDGALALPLGNKEALTYIKSGNVNLTIKVQLQNGNTVRLTPTSFEALPQHLYKIKYNIHNGEIGDVDKLEIIFNDDIENESNIEIDLTDELFEGDAPIVILEGLENVENNSLVMTDGIPFEETTKFVISAYEEIKAAKLSIVSEFTGYNPEFMVEGGIDLCNLDTEKQNTLSSAGIRVLGLYNNPEKLALIDVTDFCRNLPVGKYTISLIVTDKLGRESEESAFTVTCPMYVHMSYLKDDQGEDLDKIELGAKTAKVLISYNGLDADANVIDNPFSFKIGGNTTMEPAKIISIDNVPVTRGFDTRQYIYELELPVDAYRDDYPVDVYYGNVEVQNERLNLKVNYPEYQLEFDALSRRIMMRFEEGTLPEEILNIAKKRLRIFVNDKEVTHTYDENSGIYTVSNLEPNVTYEVKTTLHSNNSGFLPLQITTEKTEAVPNGNFEESVYNFINETIDQGGEYTRSGLGSNNKQNKEPYNYFAPVKWANTNDKTCNYEKTAESSRNTWFLVPSVYTTTGHESNTGIAIRSVGFNFSGTVPARTGSLLSSTDYNTSTPQDIYKAAGKLFLGTYDINIENYNLTSETYNEGYDFKVRPVVFKGWYKYSPCSGSSDEGTVEISLWNNEEELVNKKVNLPQTSDWKEFKIYLESHDYPAFKKVPTTLKIMFCSSKYADDNWMTESSQVPAVSDTRNIQKYLGSELLIDDLTFEY